MKRFKFTLQRQVQVIWLVVFISNICFASETIPELTVTKITDHVYLHKSYQNVKGWGLVSSNGLVVIHEQQAVIIDTPWSEQNTKKLVSWLKDHNYQVLASLSTHYHDDRTAGIKWLKQHKIATFASKLTNQQLLAHHKVTAQFTLDKMHPLIPESTLSVFYPGGGHTLDNIVVWLPKSKLLFGGCLVRSNKSKSLGFTGDAVIEQWSQSIAKVLKKYPDLNIVIPGHGSRGGVELLTHTKQLATNAVVKYK